jgi:uncharacterized membrane protein YgcG
MSNASIIIVILIALFVAALAAFRWVIRGGVIRRGRYPLSRGSGRPGGVIPPATQDGHHGGSAGYHGTGGHGDGGFTGGHH